MGDFSLRQGSFRSKNRTFFKTWPQIFWRIPTIAQISLDCKISKFLTKSESYTGHHRIISKEKVDSIADYRYGPSFHPMILSYSYDICTVRVKVEVKAGESWAFGSIEIRESKCSVVNWVKQNVSFGLSPSSHFETQESSITSKWKWETDPVPGFSPERRKMSCQSGMEKRMWDPQTELIETTVKVATREICLMGMQLQTNKTRVPTYLLSWI